ncbi:MAG: hypothetical protein R2939_08360 [Kofleriaceae bacterium]
MRKRVFVAFGAAIGCGSVSGGPDAPPGDAALDAGALAEASIGFDHVDIGATVIAAPIDTSALPAAVFYQDDGAGHLTAYPTTAGADGTWRADVPAGPVAMKLYLPSAPSITRWVTLSSRTIRSLDLQLAHPVATAAPTASLDFGAVTMNPVFAPSEQLHLLIVGTWNYNFFTGGALPMMGDGTWDPATFAYASPPMTPGSTGFPQVTTADRFALMRFSDTKLTAVLVTGLAADMTAGVNAVPGGALAPVTFDRNLNVTVNADLPAARLAAVVPALDGAVERRWSLIAAPGAAYGVNAGPRLDDGTVSDAGTVAITGTYGNPFVDEHDLAWPALFGWSTQRTGTLTYEGRTLSRVARLQTYVEPGDGATPLAVGVPQALPVSFSVGGVVLDGDGGVTLTPEGDTLAISFTVDAGTCALYRADLAALSAGAGNTWTAQTTVSLVGEQPSWRIPRDLLTAGQPYRISGECMSTALDLEGGDLTVRSLPLGLGYAEGGVFEIAP